MGVYRTCLCSGDQGISCNFRNPADLGKTLERSDTSDDLRTAVLLLARFAPIGTGFKYNITQWLVNLGENGEKYMFTHNPRFGYLFFLSPDEEWGHQRYVE